MPPSTTSLHSFQLPPKQDLMRFRSLAKVLACELNTVAELIWSIEGHKLMTFGIICILARVTMSVIHHIEDRTKSTTFYRVPLILIPENVCVMKFYWSLVYTFYDKSALFQVKVWRRTGDKPLPAPVMTEVREACVPHKTSMFKLWDKSNNLYCGITKLKTFCWTHSFQQEQWQHQEQLYSNTFEHFYPRLPVRFLKPALECDKMFIGVTLWAKMCELYTFILSTSFHCTETADGNDETNAIFFAYRLP